MKAALHRSTILETQIFVIRDLSEKRFDPTWHSHSEFQLFVVLEGAGTRFIGDSIKSFHKGELVLIAPHLPHLWRSDEPYFDKKNSLKTRGIVIFLQEDFLGKHILDRDEMINVKKLFNGAMRGLEFYGKKKLQVIKMLQALAAMQGLEGVIYLLKILNILASSKE